MSSHHHARRYTIARDCTPYGPFCIELPVSAAPHDWFFIYRTYLEPATKTGPALDELILPSTLKFSGARPRAALSRSSPALER